MVFHIHYIDGRDDNWIATFNQREHADEFLKIFNENKPDKACLIPQKKG